jgi:DNA-binding transcriptional MerR regulator
MHTGRGGRVSEYRVEELAEVAGISVEVLRSYQSKGLLPPPRHEGRLALYGRRHLERLEQIRALKLRGYSLKAIGELLGRRSPMVPAASAVEVLGEEETFTLREVAEQSGVPPAMLRSLEASGVLRPRRMGDVMAYTALDVRGMRMLLALLGSGLPMEEFMRVAQVQIDAADRVAEGAVELFVRYVREPLRASGLDEAEEAERLAAGFRLMLEATTMLMTYNFHRMVLNAVQAEIDERGSDAERTAMHREARSQLDASLPA